MLSSLACAPRRLARRYWAGRVALRENRAPTHRLTAPRRSEAARPKLSLLKSSGTRGLGGAPLQPVPGMRSARPGCRAVRDSALVAWYSSLNAPRTGGAYDSHHRTAGVAGRTRRRGGRLAARGARSKATVCGGSAFSWDSARTTQRGFSGFPALFEHFETWVGPTAGM